MSKEVIGTSPTTNEVLIKDTETGDMYWKPGTPEQISEVTEQIAKLPEVPTAKLPSIDYEPPSGVSLDRPLVGSITEKSEKELEQTQSSSDKALVEYEQALSEAKIGEEDGVTIVKPLAMPELSKLKASAELATLPSSLEIYDYRGSPVKLDVSQINELSELSGKAQFNRMQELNLIEKDAEFKAGDDNKWSFIPAYVTKAEAKFERSHINLAPEKEGGEWMSLKSSKEYTGWNDLAPKYQSIALRESLSAMNEAIDSDRASLDTALGKLNYVTNKDNLVDGAKYLRDNPRDVQTLEIAGFGESAIKGWQELNNQLVGWSAEIETQGNEFKSRVADLIIDRPHLTQLDAEKIARVEFKHEGKVLEPSPDLPTQIKLADAHFKSLSPEEQAIIKAQWKQLPVTAAEMIVPGVYVARHWTELDTKGKVINIALDAASILLAVGIFKLAGVATRQLSGVNKVSRVAKSAGKAGRELDIAQKTYNTAQKVLKPNSKLLIKHANNVAKAQAKSMKADRAFLNNLQRLQRLSPKDLKVLAKQSGLKNIDKAIISVTKSQKQVVKLWNRIDKMKFNPNAKTAKEIASNNKYLKELSKLQQAQARLQAALDNAGSALSPRYSPSPPTEEFKGFKVEWGEKKPTIKPIEDETIKSIEKYLATDKSLKPSQPNFWELEKSPVATKVKPKAVPEKVAEAKGKHQLKLKAVYEKAKAKPKEKPRIPESAFPGIKSAPKVIAKVTAATIPSEAFSRMAAAQVAKYYGTEEVVDAVSKTLLGQIVKSKGFERIVPSTVEKVNQAIREIIDIYNKALQKGKTSTEARQIVSEAAATRLKATPLSAAQTVTATNIVTKIATRTPFEISPRLFTIKSRLLRPFATKGIKAEKMGGVVVPKGTITWRQGKVWYAIKPPYKEKGDVLLLKHPPVGAEVYKGASSAYKTIQALEGDVNIVLNLDLGVQDITIKSPTRKPGKKGAIKYRKDPQRRTTGDISLKGIRI